MVNETGPESETGYEYSSGPFWYTHVLVFNIRVISFWWIVCQTSTNPSMVVSALIIILINTITSVLLQINIQRVKQSAIQFAVSIYISSLWFSIWQTIKSHEYSIVYTTSCNILQKLLGQWLSDTSFVVLQVCKLLFNKSWQVGQIAVYKNSNCSTSCI